MVQPRTSRSAKLTQAGLAAHPGDGGWSEANDGVKKVKFLRGECDCYIEPKDAHSLNYSTQLLPQPLRSASALHL